MASVIAVLTYRRKPALEAFLASLSKHCQNVPVAVFEDCAQTDETEEFLIRGRPFIERSREFEADVYGGESFKVFLGYRNLGVAGNSNRALHWFMTQTSADHLLLCNDDLEATGPFHLQYAEAHEHHGVGLFSFTAYEHLGSSFKTVEIVHRGRPLKLARRMTGSMLSATRAVVEAVGYFDDRYSFGNEHCDWNNRVMFAGQLRLDGQDQRCLDLVTPSLKPQEVESSIRPDEKVVYDNEANELIAESAKEYRMRDIYRPYSTACRMPQHYGGRYEFGIPRVDARHIEVVLDREPVSSPPILRA